MSSCFLFDVSFLLFVDVLCPRPKGNIQRGVVEGAVPGLALARDSDRTRNLLGDFGALGAQGPLLGAREDVLGVFVAGKVRGTHPISMFSIATKLVIHHFAGIRSHLRQR